MLVYDISKKDEPIEEVPAPSYQSEGEHTISKEAIGIIQGMLPDYFDAIEDVDGAISHFCQKLDAEEKLKVAYMIACYLKMRK